MRKQLRIPISFLSRRCADPAERANVWTRPVTEQSAHPMENVMRGRVMMILASAVLAGSLACHGRTGPGRRWRWWTWRRFWRLWRRSRRCHMGGFGGGHMAGFGVGHIGGLGGATSAALAQVAWRMSATSTSASDGAISAAAFTTMASIAHMTVVHPAVQLHLLSGRPSGSRPATALNGLTVDNWRTQRSASSTG